MFSFLVCYPYILVFVFIVIQDFLFTWLSEWSSSSSVWFSVLVICLSVRSVVSRVNLSVPQLLSGSSVLSCPPSVSS